MKIAVKSMLMIVLATVGVIIPMWAHAVGVVRYVDPVAGACTGNYSIANRNCTGSNGNSYATIDAGRLATGAADTLYIRVGTYTEGLRSQFPAGLSTTQRTVISAYNGETVTLAPTSGQYVVNISGRSYVAVIGFKLDGTQATLGASHVLIVQSSSIGALIENNEIFGGIAQGVMISPTSSDGILRGNYIHDNGDSDLDHGVYMQGANWIIERNRMEHNFQFGMQVYPTPTNATIRDNIFKDNCQSGTGSELVLSHTGHLFERNLVITTASGGCENGVLVKHQGPLNNTVRHNSIYSAVGGTTGIIVTSATNTTLLDNIILGYTSPVTITTSTGTTDTGNLKTGTPSAVWTSPSTGDFSLKAGSVAIDGGTNCPSVFNGSSCDQGAFEVPVFSSCVVNAGATSILRVNFTNNLRPPMRPASAVTGLTVRKNGANNPVISFTRVGDNSYDVAVTNAYAGGDSVDLSVGATNLTDSALIANTFMQPFLTALTNQSCTNNAGGAPSHTYTQAAFELHDWDGLEASPTILPHGFASTGAAENFQNYKVRVNGKVRVRVAITCGGANCPNSAFYPYVSTGGAYARVLDDFSTHNIKMCGVSDAGDSPINGSPTSNQLSTAGTFVPGGIIFTSTAIPDIIGLNNGFKTEMEFCFAFDSDAAGDFDIRAYLDDGTALTTYTVTPRLVAEPAAAGGM